MSSLTSLTVNRNKPQITKQEEEKLPPVDRSLSIPNELLLHIFRFAINTGKTNVLDIRAVCHRWNGVAGDLVASPLFWNETAKIPSFRHFSPLIPHESFAFKKLYNLFHTLLPLLPTIPEDVQEQISHDLENQTITLEDLPLTLRPNKLKYPSVAAEDYEELMKKALDHALTNMWKRITREHFHDAALYIDNNSPEEIREWLIDPDNQAKIKGITQLDLSAEEEKDQLKILPPEICFFTEVIALNLTGNQLKTLPDEIGDLTKLETLILDQNEIKHLPLSLRTLTHLHDISLKNNKLEALPDVIIEMTQLEGLNLANNAFKDLPRGVENLVNLDFLSLCDNQIQYLSPRICKLGQLTVLDLAKNGLQILPDEIGLLNQLEDISLAANHLKTLPATFNYLSKLKQLYAEKNDLQELPSQLDGLTCLEYCTFEDNYLSQIPSSLCKLRKLECLALGSNDLTSIPQEIDQLEGLKRLFLNDNQLITLPDAIGNLPNLEILHLNNNSLITLPKTVSQLSKLTDFQATGTPCILLFISGINKDPQRFDSLYAFSFRAIADTLRGSRESLDRFILSQHYQCQSAFGALYYAVLFEETEDIREKLAHIAPPILERIQQVIGHDNEISLNKALLNHALFTIAIEKIAALSNSPESIQIVSSYIEEKGGEFTLDKILVSHPVSGMQVHAPHPCIDNALLLIDALEFLDEQQKSKASAL